MLAEMQWGDEEPTPEQIEKVGAELADVVIFAMTLGNTLGIDVDEVVQKKIEHNEKRFPAHLFQDMSMTFEEAYLRRKVELGERPPSVLDNLPKRGVILDNS